MGSGGKSTSTSETANSQSTLSADGVVTGKVFNINSQGATDFTYTEEFPQSVADLAQQLIDFAGDAGKAAVGAYNTSLDTVTKYAETAKQPDLDLAKTTSSYTPIIIGVVVIGLIFILGKK